MSITLYHNPRCSKSRETLQLLRDRGLEPEIVDYLKTPLTFTTLNQILHQLGLEPRQLMRTKEKEYRELGLDNPALTRQDLIRAMIAHPILIERPILLKDGRAALGRPPETVLTIL